MRLKFEEGDQVTWLRAPATVIQVGKQLIKIEIDLEKFTGFKATARFWVAPTSIRKA